MAQLTPLTIVDSGTVFTGVPGSDAQSATFPIPCVTPSGRWFCTFRAAPSKLRNAGQRVLLTWSDDAGHAWSEPVAPFKSLPIDGKPGLIRFAGLTALDDTRLLAVMSWVDCSDPDLPYFNEATEGLLPTRIFRSESEDAGQTWSTPRLMDTSPFRVPTPLTGPLVTLANGELVCQFELNKHYDDPTPWRHASILMFSQDGGETWPRFAVVTQDPDNRFFYWDQRLAVLRDGRILDVFWTFDRQEAVYLNIHARESTDGGRTWGELWDTGVPGQPGPVFPLGDGTIAMPYVDRTGPSAIKVRRSADGGRTWPDTGELVVYASGGPSQTEAKASMQDAWAEMARFSVGLPSVAPLPGGGALLVYYAGSKTDVTAIQWAMTR